MLYLALGILSPIADVRFIGLLNYNLKLLSVPLRQNILLYLWQAEISSHFTIWSQNFTHTVFFFQAPLDKLFSITRTSHLETSTVYEDNASCVILAHSKGATVRTKHISLKWHRFKDHIKNGDMKVVKIDSSLNWAAIFTKPLTKLKHETLRRFIMGW